MSELAVVKGQVTLEGRVFKIGAWYKLKPGTRWVHGNRGVKPFRLLEMIHWRKDDWVITRKDGCRDTSVWLGANWLEAVGDEVRW